MITQNTSNIILTAIYSEGPRVKDVWGMWKRHKIKAVSTNYGFAEQAQMGDGGLGRPARHALTTCSS